MAYLHLLLPYLMKYFKEGLVIPESVKDNFKDIVETYDDIKTTFDNLYEITNNPDDKVHIDDITYDMNGSLKKNFSRNHMISEMKRIGLTYRKDLYCSNDKLRRKGVVMGIIKKLEEDSDDELDPLDMKRTEISKPKQETKQQEKKQELETDSEDSEVSVKIADDAPSKQLMKLFSS